MVSAQDGYADAHALHIHDARTSTGREELSLSAVQMLLGVDQRRVRSEYQGAEVRLVATRRDRRTCDHGDTVPPTRSPQVVQSLVIGP